METLSKEIQQMVLNGVSDVKTGFFYKKVYYTESYAVYSSETIYPTVKQLLDAIMKTEWKSLCESYDEIKKDEIKKEILESIKDCKDALSVCVKIKECFEDYDETCDTEIDICFTSVY